MELAELQKPKNWTYGGVRRPFPGLNRRRRHLVLDGVDLGRALSQHGETFSAEGKFTPFFTGHLCCVLRPANGCFAQSLLVRIDFLKLNTVGIQLPVGYGIWELS